MTADEWLTDLEAKANTAIENIPLLRGEWDFDVFQEAATPETVLRLVAMVRFLAFSAARSRGLFDDPAYWLDTAYAATEAQTKKEAQ